MIVSQKFCVLSSSLVCTRVFFSEKNRFISFRSCESQINLSAPHHIILRKYRSYVTPGRPCLSPALQSKCSPSTVRKKSSAISTVGIQKGKGEVSRCPVTVDEQDELSRIILQGASIYLGGKAGTGKSFFLRRVIQELRKKGLRVGVTGSTGVAALNIGGNTFHSFFGISVDSPTPPHSRKKGYSGMNSSFAFHLPASSSPCFRSTIKLEILRQFDVIVIDEISFLHAGYLELLEVAARTAAEKENARTPFGGLQIILSGDFLQLTSVQQNPKDQIVCPGVGKKFHDEKSFLSQKGKFIPKKRMSLGYYRDKPMFESYVFQKYLLHAEFVNIRRHNDSQFAIALNQLRIGELSPLIAKSSVQNKEQEKAIRLYAIKNAVNQYNRIKMFKLKGEEYYFPSDISVNGMSTMTWNHGEKCLSDVLIIFALSKNNKSKKMKRISLADGGALVEELRRGIDVPKHAITWCVLPEPARHLAISRIAIRFSAYSAKKCLEHLTQAIYWVMRRAKADKSNVFTKQLRGSSTASLSHTRHSSHSCLVFKYTVRTIHQVTLMMKHSIGTKLSFNLQNDYALSGKRLKIGCRVMLLKNMNQIYVNGSLGEVVGFIPASKCKDKLPSEMRPVALTSYGSREQMTVNSMEVDSSIEGGGSSSSSPADKLSKNSGSSNKTEVLRVSGRKGLVPLVRMDLDNKIIAVPYLLLPLPSPAQAEGFYSIGIICMPLTPAYAFTVHKVQGLTFNHPVLFDAAGLFPCDHIVYVAASRVTRLAFLRIVNLSPRMISVHRPSLLFSLSLTPVSEVVKAWENFVNNKESQESESFSPDVFLPTWFKRKNEDTGNE